LIKAHRYKRESLEHRPMIFKALLSAIEKSLLPN